MVKLGKVDLCRFLRHSLQAKDIMPLTDNFKVLVPKGFKEEAEKAANELRTEFRKIAKETNTDISFLVANPTDVSGCDLEEHDFADIMIIGKNGVGFLRNGEFGDLDKLQITVFWSFV